ncbi:hypothetical protein ABK040_000637 [Willaertia magna]
MLNNKTLYLRVQLRFFKHRGISDVFFFNNLFSTTRFSDVSCIASSPEEISKQHNIKELALVLDRVVFCLIPFYLNQFEEEDLPSKTGNDSDHINREERLSLDNPFFSFVIATILLNRKDVTINNLIPVCDLDNNIFTVDVPKYLKFNPQIGEIPRSLISYLNNLNCIPSSSNSSTREKRSNTTVLTRRFKDEILDYTALDTEKNIAIEWAGKRNNPDVKRIEVLQTELDEDIIFENLKRKLFEIIRKNKSNIKLTESPKSMRHFSFLQLVKDNVVEKWFLKVNALNLYLKLLQPASLILDMSQQALVQRFLSILEIQIKSSLHYSSYFYTALPFETKIPAPFCTKENYERFVKDRHECYSTLQKEYPGELYYLIELSKCFEFQDNVCLLTGNLALLRNRLQPVTYLIEDLDFIELNDHCYREYSKLYEFLEREICKFKVEKYLINNREEMNEKDIVNIVKEHYNNLAVIVREKTPERYASMFRRGFTFMYKWYIKDEFV